MTAVPSEFTIDTGERTPETSGLPRRAMVFLALAGLATVAAAAIPVSELNRDTNGWWTFFVLGAAAAATQLFVARTPRGAARYYTTIVFLVAGVLLLPAGLVALLGVVQHIPEWLKMRYPWYIQTFNIVNYTADCLVAWFAAHLILSTSNELAGPQQWALAGVVASVVFVMTNHILLAAMMHFAERTPIRKSDLFTLESLSTDLILAFLGRGARDALARQPLADRGCGRAPHPHPPLAERAGARGGGPRRLEDGSVQRAALRGRAA